MALSMLLLLTALPARSADKELLDILLENGAITQAQYDRLIARDEITAEDLIEPDADPGNQSETGVVAGPEVDAGIEAAIETEVARQVEEKSPGQGQLRFEWLSP